MDYRLESKGRGKFGTQLWEMEVGFKEMNAAQEIALFMEQVGEDPRIGPMHISLYTAILYLWSVQGFDGPVIVSARTLMPVAKIAGPGPYHRSIRQLHEYGYIRYEPSCDPAKPSRVYLGQIGEV